MHQTLEERVAKLEAELIELRSQLKRRTNYVEITSQKPCIRDRVPPEYWAAREARLDALEILKPLDSTEAVSADRDDA